MMALTRKNLLKWVRMLTGTSIDHVEQGVGLCYSLQSVSGFYNDFTKKVTKDKRHYFDEHVFSYNKGSKSICYPAIEIFQYGLGCYDLMLLKRDEELMKRKFLASALWALQNQNSEGGWDAFSFNFPDRPYSAMAQGEGASLLVRAFIETGDESYLVSAEKALVFMVKNCSFETTNQGGKRALVLLEFADRPYVFNGWIFAFFGLYDFLKIASNDQLRDDMNASLEGLRSEIGKIDNGYWSKYQDNQRIASPFYHQLHIALLHVMGQIAEDEIFFEVEKRLIGYSKKVPNRIRAFFVKSWQKISTPDD